MVKNINITLDDKDYEALAKIKGKQSWRDFVMQLLNK